jgi:hypothetical protein
MVESLTLEKIGARKVEERHSGKKYENQQLPLEILGYLTIR